MKYIRTPFTIFEVVEETDVVYRVRAKWTPTHLYSKSKCQTDVIKQADTIEEVCDYEMHYDNNGEFVIRPIKHVDWASLKRVIMDKWFKDCKLAIKTDKGLIYVAKMNDKGELELI